MEIYKGVIFDRLKIKIIIDIATISEKFGDFDN
jgi:hypothetical protein